MNIAKYLEPQNKARGQYRKVTVKLYYTNTMEKHVHALLMFRIQLWWGEKKRQHSDSLVCFSCRRDPFQFSICPKERRAEWLLSHAIPQMREYFSVIQLYVAKSTPSEITGKGQGEYPKNSVKSDSYNYWQSHSSLLNLFCLKQLRKH